MGQKVNPIGFRLGIIKGWDSNWFGGKHYADKLVEDAVYESFLMIVNNAKKLLGTKPDLKVRKNELMNRIE